MLFLIILLFTIFNINAYYLACNKKDCITNSNLSELHKIIKKQNFVCYDNYNKYKREHELLCYNNIISFAEIRYNIKRCDDYILSNNDNIYKPVCKLISNDPFNCTITPIPILRDNIILDNSIIQSDLIEKIYDIKTKQNIYVQLEFDALNNKAYGIINYNESIITIPIKKCKIRKIGKLRRRICKWYNEEYLKINYRYIL